MGRHDAVNTLKSVFFFSCPISFAIWDGVKPGRDVICKGSRASFQDALAPCWVFRWLPFPCHLPSVERTVPPPKPSPLLQMRREKPEGREIKCGLFLICLIIESWQSMSQNRKYLIKIASVKPGTQAGDAWK